MNFALNPARAIAFLWLSLTQLTGGASLPVARDIHGEAHAGPGLLPTKPRVSHTDNGLLVSGFVTHGAFHSSPARTHIDIEVLSPDNSRVVLVPTASFPNPIPHRRRSASSASYAERIAGDVPADSRIQVALHPVSLRKCHNSLLPRL